LNNAPKDKDWFFITKDIIVEDAERFSNIITGNDSISTFRNGIITVLGSRNPHPTRKSGTVNNITKQLMFLALTRNYLPQNQAICGTLHR